jgi:uncharacterized protein (DUF885 family)
MKRNNAFALTMALLIATLSAVARSHALGLAGSSASPSSETLNKAAEDYWQHSLKESISLRLRHGLPITELPEISLKKSESDAAFAKSLLDRIHGVKQEDLSHEELLTLQLLQWNLQDGIEGARFYWLSSILTPYSCPIPGVNQVFTTYRFKSKSDLGNYLTLLRQYPSFIKGISDKVRQQYSKDILLPQEEISLVLPFVSSFVKEPERSALYVDKKRLESIGKDADVQQFQREVAELIGRRVNPALKDLADFLSGDYQKKAPHTVGLSQYPDGMEYYRYLVRHHTTLEITPEEVHRIGVERVAALNSGLDKLQEQAGFKGSRAEFRHFLKTDARFFPKTPEEIGAKLQRFAELADSRVDMFFLKRPRAPYGVKRLDPAVEGAMTFGYYQIPTGGDPKGNYLFNGSNLSDRSLLNAGALALHELVPGHHFQLSLQSENEGLPSFRREAYYTAFNEGWGDYSAELGIEMGVYKDPYDMCGRAAMDLFISVRLVVDTGMNYMGWSRSRAVDYMRENEFEAETQINTESLRYSVDMPGQALAYKMGSLKILELREKASRALGSRFDIREFHNAVIGSGSLPLTILEKQIDWYIKRTKG